MKTQECIEKLYKEWANEDCIDIEELPKSGSDRIYFRLHGNKKTAIGVFNKDLKENKAFIHFSRHFHNIGIFVPEIYITDLDNHCYLISDLGEETLFDNLLQTRTGKEFPPHLVPIYKNILSDLIIFQLKAGANLDYTLCYPRNSFDKQSILWDLNYFKYYFLKLAKVPFDEQLLEDDFNTFANYLLETEHSYFMYRDFQSRNIMLKDGKTAYIDYQGGRKGALQYDVASLLYDAKADIPEILREELLSHYISELNKKKNIDTGNFKQYYYGYVLIRIMQAMGAYGFRGLYEKKQHFLKSIPFAIKNLKSVLEKSKFKAKIPHLFKALEIVTQSKKIIEMAKDTQDILTVTINSFSYKRGIPIDKNDNGGGFVFDCRAIHNPGRYEQYKQLTGKDSAVIHFFEENKDMENFLNPIKTLVSQSIEVYNRREFTNLMINFGCTGGRHRSVYAAEQIASYIQDNFEVNITLKHIEREIDDKLQK